MPKQFNPIQNLFVDIEKIMEFIEVKNKVEAEKYETLEMAKESALWIHAMMQEDSYLSYKKYYTHSMFQEVTPNLKYQIIDSWLNNIYNVPLIYRDHLLKIGRKIVIDNYVETNDYYRMLNGQPPINTTPDNFIYLSEKLQHEYYVTANTPVHKLSDTIQNRYILTEEYKNVLKDNPDKLYLKYFGIYRIDIFLARRAKDFQLLRYIPMGRTDINPYILKEFASLYNQYRDYVISTIYNDSYINLFENYREFIHIIILSLVMMQLCSRAVEHSSDNMFLDDTIIHTIFEMYGIPRSLILTQEVKRKLVVAINTLKREKATNPVFYDLVKILKFDDVTISKLMLIKQQLYDDNGKPLFDDGTTIDTPEDMDLLTTINPTTGKPYKSADVELQFQAIDLKSENPYQDITTNKSKRFTYEEITSADPRWWELPDTRNAVINKHYSYTNSKYIMIESMVDQTNSLFESIYFLRMLMDNKYVTDEFMITIPEVFSTTKISLFDLSIFIIAAMCENNNLTGEIISTASGILSVAGFNFDIDLDLFKDFLNKTNYVNKERILQFIGNISMKSMSDINRLFTEIMIPLRDWLTYEMSATDNRDQFNEYEKIYRALFTYDAVRSVFVDNFLSPVARIKNEYNLTDTDWKAFSLFYPHMPSGKAITMENKDLYPDYFPFLGSGSNESKHWYAMTADGKYVYFYDIINSPDLRYIIDDNGDNVENSMWWRDGQIDSEVVNHIITQINSIDSSELNNAYFKTTTYIPGTNMYYRAGELLPVTIRGELFKKLLISKVTSDMNGEAQPAMTYREYITRKNPIFIPIFEKAEFAKDSWMNDLMNIVIAIENELNMHLKYFEQSAVGTEMFFKPLVTLIKYFKSHMIDFARASLTYIFSDKIDAGGNSNMLKMFDEISRLIIKMIIANKDENAEFGLYDTSHKIKFNLLISDKSTMIKNSIIEGADKIISLRKSNSGSLRMVDECRFLKNGRDVNSNWIVGEDGVGRYVNNTDPVDTEAWKDYVESYNK